ncbi:hypothetical protein ACFQHN_19535 [Natrialbaceae archaeon GCM10025896]
MFEDYLEETVEFQSLSQFFRTAARRHITTSDEQEVSIDPEDIARAVEDALSGVYARLEKLDDQLAELDASVTSSDEIQSLTHEIMAQLPSKEELVDVTEMEPMAPDSVESARQLSTVDAWASYFDVDVDKARRALARAQEFPDVEFRESRFGTRRYYKEEGM